jgi:hypothetical protein
MGEYKVVFVQVGEANGQVGFERLPVAIDESMATPYVAVKHGVELGQRIVVNGAAVLSSQRL